MMPYYDQIIKGDVSFFLDKDFSDLNNKEVMNNIVYFKELYIKEL